MHRVLLYSFLLLFSQGAFASVDCQALDKLAQTVGEIIPDAGSGRDIVGKARLQFYSAPNASCKISGLFVIPGDMLFASSKYGKYTRVSFIALRKSDKKDVEGWVLSSRLRENGQGIVPGEQMFH